MADAVTTPSGAGGTAVKTVIITVLDWFQYIGGIIAIFGVAALAFSIHNDNPDGKTRALKIMAMGAVCMTLKTLAGNFISLT